MDDRFRVRTTIKDKLILQKYEDIKSSGEFKTNQSLNEKIFEIGIQQLYEKTFSYEEYLKRVYNIKKDNEKAKLFEYMFKDLTLMRVEISIIKELISSILNIKISEMLHEEIDPEDIKNGYYTDLPDIYKKMEQKGEEKYTKRMNEINLYEE